MQVLRKSFQRQKVQSRKKDDSEGAKIWWRDQRLLGFHREPVVNNQRPQIPRAQEYEQVAEVHLVDGLPRLQLNRRATSERPQSTRVEIHGDFKYSFCSKFNF